jgi:hypothetical protein
VFSGMILKNVAETDETLRGPNLMRHTWSQLSIAGPKLFSLTLMQAS